MSIQFKELSALDFPILKDFFNARETHICEGFFNTNYMWSNKYHTHYYMNNDFLIFLMHIGNIHVTIMPYCEEKYIIPATETLCDYFKNTLHQEIIMYAVDKGTKNIITKHYGTAVNIIDCRENYDYLYDADSLRTLSGKALHKKRNHLNNFMNKYNGKYEFKILNKDSTHEIMSYLTQWNTNKSFSDNYDLKYEYDGLLQIMNNFDILDYKICGVYIDGILEAFSLGSYNHFNRQAYIHTEKANIQYQGLYQYINQQFLVNCFPDAKLVNREDDLGIEGLRKSKLSYHPIELLEKFIITFSNK